MKAFQTRRDFFGWSRGLLGAAGLASQTVSLKAAPASVDEGEDYYDKLGVTKIINAAGTYTMFTASIMPPPVQAAVARAAKNPVRLRELQLKDEVIVQKTHRYGYDHALRNCGIRYVEVETMAEYEAAFNDRTVMAHFYN